MIVISSFKSGAEKDRFHEVALTATKVANNPQKLLCLPKKAWWAVAMGRKPNTYDLSGSRHHMNQGLYYNNKNLVHDNVNQGLQY